MSKEFILDDDLYRVEAVPQDWPLDEDPKVEKKSVGPLRRIDQVIKHYGPGSHPGTGTPQTEHAGGRGRQVREGGEGRPAGEGGAGDDDRQAYIKEMQTYPLVQFSARRAIFGDISSTSEEDARIGLFDLGLTEDQVEKILGDPERHEETGEILVDYLMDEASSILHPIIAPKDLPAVGTEEAYAEFGRDIRYVLQDFEYQHGTDAKEYATLVDAKGEVYKRAKTSGSESSVNFEPVELMAIKNGGMITHNHPGGAGPSWEDFSIALEWGLGTIVATSGTTRHIMQFKPMDLDQVQEIKKTYSKAEVATRGQFWNLIEKDEISRKEANDAHHIKLFEIIEAVHPDLFTYRMERVE